MYKVLFEPTYDESKELGVVVSAAEALELIEAYCHLHQWEPVFSFYERLNVPNCKIVDVGTGHDYFSIINEDGGRVIFDEEENEQSECTKTPVNKKLIITFTIVLIALAVLPFIAMTVITKNSNWLTLCPVTVVVAILLSWILSKEMR